MRPGRLGVALLLAVAAPPRLAAQQGDLGRERQEFATWLGTAPLSPYAALAVQPIGPGLVLGPAEGDIPLPGMTRSVVKEERGTVTLDDGKTRRALPRNTAVPVGTYRFMVTGSSGRTQLVVYGPVKGAHPPAWFPPVPALAWTVPLESPERKGAFRTLGPDGLETEATEAGFVTLPLPGKPARLRVYRMGSAEDDEAELQVFFRDSTSGKGSYPAGRFVTLDPAGGGRYRVDLNRARNPFCAYNSVFPCPAPWPGNTISPPVTAGEQYEEK